MKHLILLLTILSACGSPYELTQYSKNYQHTDTKYERAGYSCEFAVLKIVNKTKAAKTLSVNDIAYEVPARDKICINVKPGFNELSDDSDSMRLRAVPCHVYTHVYR